MISSRKTKVVLKKSLLITQLEGGLVDEERNCTRRRKIVVDGNVYILAKKNNNNRSNENRWEQSNEANYDKFRQPASSKSDPASSQGEEEIMHSWDCWLCRYSSFIP